MNASSCTTTARGGLAPGELARLTAGCLTAAGITVTQNGAGPDLELELHPYPGQGSPAQERAHEAGTARWILAVDDYAGARLYVLPAQAGVGDPRWIAGVAAALLTGNPGSGAPGGGPGPCAEDGGIMRAAGLELRRRGFTVRLNTFPDQESLELCADISVTGSSGIVCIADSGTICFERSYWADHASAGRAPRDPGWLPDPAACARAIAGTVTAAIAAAQPRRHTG